MNIEQLAKDDLKDIVFKQQEVIFRQEQELRKFKKNNVSNKKNKKEIDKQHLEVQMSVEFSSKGEIIDVVVRSIFPINISHKVVKEYYSKEDPVSILNKLDLDLDLNNKQVNITKIFKYKDYWNIQYKCENKK